jgi:hypothetical protein
MRQEPFPVSQPLQLILFNHQGRQLDMVGEADIEREVVQDVPARAPPWTRDEGDVDVRALVAFASRA